MSVSGGGGGGVACSGGCGVLEAGVGRRVALPHTGVSNLLALLVQIVPILTQKLWTWRTAAYSCRTTGSTKKKLKLKIKKLGRCALPHTAPGPGRMALQKKKLLMRCY